MKSLLSILFFFCFCSPGLLAGEYDVTSPDGNITITVSADHELRWSVLLKGTRLAGPSQIALDLGNGLILGIDPEVSKATITNIDESFEPVVPTKTSSVRNYCNELRLDFKEHFSVCFRAYNNGVAYRTETKLTEEIRVYNETAEFVFPADYEVVFPEEFNFVSHYEQEYKFLTLDSLTDRRFCYLPVLLNTPDNIKLAITEADLYDYPCMFLFGTGGYTLRAGFPKVPLETRSQARAFRNEVIVKEADYMARTVGTRSFPWRVLMIAEDDSRLLENQLVFQLSRPLVLEDTQWIRPGKVAWDWWNALNIYGVDFRAGINTETYKYYIDFASLYGLDYIILDEGWSDTRQILDVVPEVDLPEIIRYGKEKNVGVILWVLWKPLDQDLENVLSTYSQWGIKGVKVDFMQRADQYMVNFYERVARVAAQNHLSVDFHGAFKPAGLRRAYPNILNYEGLRGLEHCKWSHAITPDHDLILPFTRMLAGPMDYTPGAMINAQRQNFRPNYTTPMSQGTRCHQLAMYIIYEAPLQMLSDSPSSYLKDPECTGFIARMPVTWEDTRVLEAKAGDYLVMARRQGVNWYIGGMTDWEPRDFTIKLSFLDEGDYTLEIFQDGINADRYGSDYKKVDMQANKNSQITIKMLPGGGWAAIAKKK